MLTRPTIQEIKIDIENDFGSLFNFPVPLLPNSIAKSVGAIMTGATHLQYGYIDQLAKNAMLSTATTKYLDLWSAIWGIPRNPASFAKGSILITGVATTPVPQNTSFLRGDGVEYTTDALVLIGAGGSVLVDVTALEAGEDGNTDLGTEISISSVIVGVDEVATIQGNINSGSKVEEDEALRIRVLNRIQETPQGGNKNDFEQWALTIDGVTRAWVFENPNGVGTVGVTFVLDNETSIIPDAVKVIEVDTYIDEKRPLTSLVNVYAPTLKTQDLEIALYPNTASVQAEVQAEVKDLFLRDGGAGGVVKKTDLDIAIGLAIGEVAHTHNLIGDINVTQNEVLDLGTITWSDI